jgi:hypothetical protein
MHREGPIKEKVDRTVFTDREDVFARLRQWLGWVENHVGKSVGLIGHRRVGKTAILHRLYNDLFWQKGMIIPFYFEMRKEPIWIKTLAVRYFTTFAKQYIAFRLQIPELVEQEDLTLEGLQPYLADLGNDVMVREIEQFPRASETMDPQLLFHRAIDFPSTLAVRHHQRVVVIFDEFQYMDEYVCWDAERKNPIPRYSGAFHSVCEYLDAPMLVAGSQVSLMEHRTLNGLRGRFSAWRLGPLSIDDGTELALRLARYHDLDLTAKSAYEVSRLAGGHPFYITRLVCSPAPDKDLRNPESLAAVAEYEVKQGEIKRFWNEHFRDQAGLLVSAEAKHLLFALLQWEEETPQAEKDKWGGASYKELAARVGMEPIEARALLDRLQDADLIEEGETDSRFRGLPDPLLERCLRLNYGDEVLDRSREDMAAETTQHFQERIAELEGTVANLRGHLRDLLGRTAELAVQRVMKQGFRGQRVEGTRFFNCAGGIALPQFARVRADYVATEGGEQYQLDNVGLPERPEREETWVTEQKNWEKRVGLPEARKFARAVEAYQAERGLKRAVAWLYGRAGFTEAARAFLEKEGILYSDQEQLLDLAEELGLVGV